MNFTTGLKRTSIYAATVVLSLAATTANAACEDPAGPYVYWKSCDKGGADLTGATLTGATLTGVRWMDGLTCGEGSIRGECN